MLCIRGALCFSPDPLGERDVLIAGSEIIGIAKPGAFEHLEVAAIDAAGKHLLPGFVDVLTHPCGGGGEGGFANRTAEIPFDTFVRAGVTTPVGALGTDSLGRSLDVLYGNVMALRAQGLGALMYSGAYRMPAPTLTGDIARDIYLVDPVVGVGEVAIADHRGSQPSVDELRRLASDVQLGGILAGQGGVVFVHVGDGDSRLSLLRDVIDSSDLSPSVLFPTHVNRSTALLDEAARWTLDGGYVDITVSTTPELIAAGDIPAADALRRLLEAGAPPEKITLSSDAGGSLPLYVDGELKGLTAASPAALHELLGELYEAEPELYPIALAGMTRNAARGLKLSASAEIVEGAQADIVLTDSESGAISAVFCRGKRLL